MRISSIEYLRIICLFFVILIHENVLGLFGDWIELGNITDEISRFAVPVFFIIGGFFCRVDSRTNFWAPSWAALKKLLPAWVFWTAFYCIADKSRLFYPAEWTVSVSSIALLPLSGGAGYHLWFVSAYVIGLLIFSALVTRWPTLMAATIAGLLYSVGIVIWILDSRYGTTLPLLPYRNGLLFAPVFMLTGFLIAKSGFRLRPTVSLFVASLGAGIHILEGRFWDPQSVYGHDYSVGTYFFATGLFLFTLSMPVVPSRLADLGKAVFGGYLVHLFILRIIAAHLHASGPVFAFASAAVVLVFSLLLSAQMGKVRGVRRLVGL